MQTPQAPQHPIGALHADHVTQRAPAYLLTHLHGRAESSVTLCGTRPPRGHFSDSRRPNGTRSGDSAFALGAHFWTSARE